MPMKKFTLAQLAEAREAIQNIIKAKLPVTTTWKLMEFADAVQTQFRRIDEVRTGVLSKHGALQGDGSYSVMRTALPGIEKELEELLAIEVKLSLPAIKSEELLCAHLPVDQRPTISAEDLAKVKFLFPEFKPTKTSP